MARRDAASPKRSKRYGWRRPRWKDRAFLCTVGLAAIAVAIQVAIAWDGLNGPLAWAAIALQALVTWIIVSAIIRTRVGMRRAIVDGIVDSHRKAWGRESGQTRSETWARTSGRTVGRAIGAYKRSQNAKK